ncbi:beta-glucosidase [Mycobacterium sp. 852013-51886_SCH5428379]|nr:beta-glucosidase [Mycobacterium sp. 852013-51886_SCH5428379]
MSGSMRWTRGLCALAATSGLLVACAPAAEQPEAPQPVVTPVNTAVAQPGALPNAPAPLAPGAPACGDGAALLAGMSARDKLAQLLMVGVSDAADARAVADAHRVGGIMIASWTDKSMLSDGSLAEIASSATPLPLAVSVDEEGGRVSRLSGLIGAQPSARELAATSTPEQVYGIARERGQAMRRLGITIDFAPVVDVTDADASSVIGDRAFGSDPMTVTEYAGAYARGLRDAGVLPVLKHFPGHGSASGDSHAQGVVTPPLAELQERDLVPYRALTAQPPVGVMVGHMQVPGLTGSDPASLSPAAYGLLRSGDYGGPGFNGPVFTDDISSMRAITDRYGVPDAALRALQAGADTALWVSTAEVPAVLDRLEKALASGELSPSRVDQSVLRMAAVKGPSPLCGG